MRYIPTTLQAHLNTDGTTVAYLLKIVARNGTIFGVTSLDQDLVYNDGAGAITYRASIGADLTASENSASLSIDNSEATLLFFDFGNYFTEEQVEAGVLDYAEFYLYRVNWADLSQGHYILQTGYTGAVRSHDNLAGIVELRGLPQKLKQSIIQRYSLTCRTRFGSGGDTGTSCGLRKGQCRYPAESLWQNHSVAAIGAEADRLFTLNATPSVSGPNGALSFVPGLIEWLTGNNAGLYSEVEALDTADITLRFGTFYAVEVGDTLRIRPDCDKKFETCRDDFDNVLNFRGEPLIPLSEQNQTTPGARYPAFPGITLPSGSTERDLN